MYVSDARTRVLFNSITYFSVYFLLLILHFRLIIISIIVIVVSGSLGARRICTQPWCSKKNAHNLYINFVSNLRHITVRFTISLFFCCRVYFVNTYDSHIESV